MSVRFPSDIGLRGSQKRSQWRAILQQARALLSSLSVPTQSPPGSFNGLTVGQARQYAGGILGSLADKGTFYGVAVGAGAMVQARATSIISGIVMRVQENSQAAAEEDAAAALIQGALGALPNASSASRSGFTLPPVNTRTSSGTGSAGVQGGNLFTGAGEQFHVYTEEGPAGSIGMPGAGGYEREALDVLVQERSRLIQSELDDLAEYGEFTIDTTAPAVGKLSGVKKIRQTSGFLDGIYIEGTAGDKAIVWVNCQVTPTSAADSSESNDWDDTDAVTAATSISGKPYLVVIPEDGYVVVDVGIQGMVSIGVEARTVNIRATESRFKTRAHRDNSGGGHFSAMQG